MRGELQTILKNLKAAEAAHARGDSHGAMTELLNATTGLAYLAVGSEEATPPAKPQLVPPSGGSVFLEHKGPA